MNLRSTSFSHEQEIPVEFTCDGDDRSPHLSWDEVPEGCESFALIADDPDAPGKVFVHWVYFNIPASVTSLPAGLTGEGEPGYGGRQGINDMGKIGYGGPCPPGGDHRYYFKLYALDTTLDLSVGATKDDVLKAMSTHVLNQAQLMGTYSR